MVTKKGAFGRPFFHVFPVMCSPLNPASRIVRYVRSGGGWRGAPRALLSLRDAALGDSLG